MTSWVRYAGRLVLPLGLLAAALVAWTVADRMGSVAHAESQAASGADAGPNVAAPMFSVRRVPEFAAGSSRDATVALALDSLPGDPGGLSCAAVLVDGSPVLSVRGDQPLVPSYAQLFITAHAAIDVLGSDFRYETRVLATDRPDDNGRIFDGIYVVGGGDPVLMTRNYASSFRPQLDTRTSIEALAASMVEAGVVRIDGGVIAIERRYDDQRSLPGWPATVAEDGLVGPLSALQLDDGFEVRAVANLGVAVPAEQPALHAADGFAEELGAVDVQVSGTNRVLGAEEELPSLVPVASIMSPPFSEIVFQMLAVNDASAAELILKELGVATASEGSTQAGARAVQQVVQNQGVSLTLPFRDGSGLDPIGGSSCSQLVAVADSIPDGHPTLEVLPAYSLPAVFDGLLADLEVESDLRLVGGVEDDASGFVARTVDPGARITIASIINRPGGPSATDLAYQEALVELVDQLRSSTNFENLEPDN